MNPLNSEETKYVRGIPSIVLGVVDFCLLNLAFFLLNYWKRGSFELAPKYGKLLLAFYGVWFLVSLANKKFQWREYAGLGRGLWTLARCGLYLAYCVAVMVVIMGLYGYSRGQVFGTCLVFVGLEGVVFWGVYFLLRRSNGGDVRREPLMVERPARISWRLMVVDFVLVGVSFFVVNYLKRDGFHVLPDYEKLLLLIYGLWFVCSLATRKFERLDYVNYYHGLWPWIKAMILLAFSMGVMVFLFRFRYFSRTQVFGPMVVLMVLETVFYRFYFERKKRVGAEGDIESADTVSRILKQEPLTVETDLEALKQAFLSPIRERLRDRYLKNHSGLFSLMDRSMDLAGILRAETAIRNSSEMLYSDTVGERYMRLFVNLRKINDIRYINQYFLAVHNLLIPGGYLVGRAHTLATHREWMIRKFPRQLANALYAVDFLFNRVMPKLPWVKQVYFSVTRGKNRVMSRSELLGRLCFCGFEIVGEEDIDERFCFVVRKAKTISMVENPSYGPLVGFNRIGAGNKPIRTYKFRTMHPYSEFLQDYVYEKSGLQKGGKLENDFRITVWGKVMRKLWLDELPMLYNWVRGELQIFGVRPLSAHYFSLYPEDLQELRGRVKPGLVPPFYADMPVTFEEICESERRYILAYLERPVWTQVRYFWKAFYNIVFRGARSG